MVTADYCIEATVEEDMMDTSETYIKMCQKAKELHALINSGEAHQFFCCEVCGQIASEDTGSYWVDCDCTPTNTRLTWLPRQDQLQEMVAIPKTASLPTLTQLTLFYQFWQKEDGEHGLPYFALFASMEQLWLAFVMKEKYNKVWTGQEWVKNESG